jgi:hypothetical protein
MTSGSAGGLPPDPGRAWTAEIEWRDGGERARFVAVARRAGSRRSVTIAESPWLGWPPGDADSIRALGAAVRQLHGELTRAGWTPLAPGSAWFAKRLAWEPVDAAGAEALEPPGRVALFAPAPPWPESVRGRWRCEICWDAGWSQGRFEAVAYPPRGRRRRHVAASRAVGGRLMAEPDPRSEAHRRELDQLAVTLRERGWRPAGAGALWYGARFYWPGDGSPERVFT